MNALHQACAHAIASADVVRAGRAPSYEALAAAAVMAEAQRAVAGAPFADAIAAVQLDWYANDRKPEGDYGLPEALAEAAQDVALAALAALAEEQA